MSHPPIRLSVTERGRLHLTGRAAGYPAADYACVSSHADDLVTRWRRACQVAARACDLPTSVRAAALAAHEVHARREIQRATSMDLLGRRCPGLAVARATRVLAQRSREHEGRVVHAVRAAWHVSPYRRAAGTWAGGHHGLEVTCSEYVQARTATWKVWSKNGKWSGLDARTVLAVDPRRYPLDRAELHVVERLVTLAASPIACATDEQVYDASWIRQARGLDVRVQHGVIYRRRSRAGGAWLPWIHASTLAAARSVTSRLVREARAQVSP